MASTSFDPDVLRFASRCPMAVFVAPGLRRRDRQLSRLAQAAGFFYAPVQA